MTTPRPNNSVLVLAALGVYLGLMLAGATPHVLAQAAMTKQFDIKDEVEVKDDLDKKPEGPELFATKASGRKAEVSDEAEVMDYISERATSAHGVALSGTYRQPAALGNSYTLSTVPIIAGFDTLSDNAHSPIAGQASLDLYRYSAFDRPARPNHPETQTACTLGRPTVVTRLPRGSLDTPLAADAK